jgi:6,7-dimethyl-8-ribityllumazine synthase
MQGVGFSLQEAARKRLEELVTNGLALGAAKVAKTVDGKFNVDMKSQVLKETVDYVEKHGEETLQKLGVLPGSTNSTEVIEARAEKQLADPNVATGVIK